MEGPGKGGRKGKTLPPPSRDAAGPRTYPLDYAGLPIPRVVRIPCKPRVLPYAAGRGLNK
jgi:hypothetical protein